MKKYVPLLVIAFLCISSFVVMACWPAITEFAYEEWYRYRHPAYELLAEVPAGYQQAQIVGGAFGQGRSPNEDIFWFSYESWYDGDDSALYYRFACEGQKKLFVHSKLFPMLFGWRHLEMEPGQTIYVKIPDVGPDEWEWGQEMMSVDDRCPPLSFSLMSGSMDMLIPSR